MTGNPEKLKLVEETGRKDVLFAVTLTPKSPRLFFGSSDAKVHALDLSEEKPESKSWGGHQSYVTGVALCGDQLVSGSYDGRLIWWEQSSGKQIRAVDAHRKWIRGVWSSDDGKTIVSVADDMVCRVWDAASGKMLRELRGHAERTLNHFPSMLYCAAISSDNKLLATGDKVGHVVIWELATGKELASIEVPIMYTWDPKARIHSIGGVRSLAFSPDSKWLAVGGMGTVGNIDHLGGKSRIEVFDWKKGERIHEEKDNKFKGLVERLEFSPDGKWLASAGGDNAGFIQFHDTSSWKPIKQDKAPMHVHDFVFNETYDMIYAAGHNKFAQWQL